MAQKKQGVKSVIPKEKEYTHPDDWNSRFWIGKIPEYKPRSAVYDKKTFKVRKGPKKLPKIQSAHLLIKETSPINEEASLKTFKVDSENTSKIDITINTRSECNLEVERKTRLNSIQDLRRTNHNLQDSKKSSYRSTRNLSEHSSESSKKMRNIQNPREFKQSLNVDSKNDRKDLQGSKSVNSKPLSSGLSAGHLPSISTNYAINYVSKFPEPDDFKETFEIKENSSSSEDDEQELMENKQIAVDILEQNILVNSISTHCLSIVKESCNEIISAHLVLFSSYVLDEYIIEVLNAFIQNVSDEVYREYTDIEYIDFKDAIITSTIKEELRKIVYANNLEMIASSIMHDHVDVLPIEEIVSESISEEKKCNKKIIKTVGNSLVDALIEEEWVEVLAEDEINSFRIEQIWKFFPQNLQKDFSKSHFNEIANRLCESMYFDILNEVIGGIWCEAIILSVVNGNEEESIESIMPVKKKEKSARKS